MWPFTLNKLFYQQEERLVWVKVRILYETDKAILVQHCRKCWIPKSRIYGIRLRKTTFEIYTKQSMVG